MLRVLAKGTGLLRRVFDVLLIALIVVILIGVILGKIVPFTGRETIIVGGASMEPGIGLGSAIIVAPVRPTDLAIGDVVTLKVGPANAIFTHRIVATVERADGRWIRTKGDANPDPDPTLVPATAVVGRMEASIPLAGYLLALMSIPAGVVFLIALAATLLACAWLLESLELDRVPRTLLRGPRTEVDLGEPIARRTPGVPIESVPEVTPRAARPNVAERIAASRATRRRRRDWARRTPHLGDRGVG
jgi:signal peptidase I